jgi:hypothetical protein
LDFGWEDAGDGLAEGAGAATVLAGRPAALFTAAGWPMGNDWPHFGQVQSEPAGSGGALRLPWQWGHVIRSRAEPSDTDKFLPKEISSFHCTHNEGVLDSSACETPVAARCAAESFIAALA